MKVALISFARRGGMVHFQAELAGALARATPVVAVSAADGAQSYFSHRVAVFEVNVGRGPLASLSKAANPLTWYRLLAFLRQSEADVIHIVAAHEWNPILAIIAKMMHKPLVYTAHDPVPHRGAPLRMRISNAIVVKMANAVIVLTRYGRTQLLAQGFAPNQVFLIPLGIYSLLAKRRRRYTPTENRILFFGRIEPYKGLQVLLSAFSSISAALPDWQLVIAGTGPLPENLRRSAPDRVLVVNRYLTDDEVADLMGRARVVVLPYLEATQSAVIATAYAFGKPVIVTRVGGLPEMVVHGKTGLVVPPDNPGALARAIASLACDSERLGHMGRLVRSVGGLRWSWERIARLHLAMYKKMLRPKTPQ